MTIKSVLPRLAIALAAFGFSAATAAAQGQGYGLGEWNLVTQGGASICHVVLTNRPIPAQGAWRAFVRGGPRCIDGRVRALAMWSVRGNRMGLADGQGAAIADLDEQNQDLYARGEWQLMRRGAAAAPQPPAAPNAGQFVGEWSLVSEDVGSVCRLTLTNRFSQSTGAFRAISQGGGRCSDPRGQRVAYWRLQGNTIYLTDINLQEMAKLDLQAPNLFAGGGHVLRRRGF